MQLNIALGVVYLEMVAVGGGWMRCLGRAGPTIQLWAEPRETALVKGRAEEEGCMKNREAALSDKGEKTYIAYLM